MGGSEAMRSVASSNEEEGVWEGSGVWWREVVGGGGPVVVTGEGSSLMLEWSSPTAQAVLRTLQHLTEHYQLFQTPPSGRGETGSFHTPPPPPPPPAPPAPSASPPAPAAGGVELVGGVVGCWPAC